MNTRYGIFLFFTSSSLVIEYLVSVQRAWVTVPSTAGVVQPGEVLVGYFPSLRSLDLSRNAIELEIALWPCAALSGGGAGTVDGHSGGLGLEEISVWGNEVAEVMLSEATGAAAAATGVGDRTAAAVAGVGYRTGRDGKFGIAATYVNATVAREGGAGGRRGGTGGAGDAGGGGITAAGMTRLGNGGGPRGAFGASATQRARAAHAALVDAVAVAAAATAASAAHPGVFTPVPAARLGGVGTLAVTLRDTGGRAKAGRGQWMRHPALPCSSVVESRDNLRFSLEMEGGHATPPSELKNLWNISSAPPGDGSHEHNPID